MLTVKTLIDLLQAYDDDDVVIIEYPGMQYSPLAGIKEAVYEKYTTWDGDAWDRTEDIDGINCILLSTVR